MLFWEAISCWSYTIYHPSIQGSKSSCIFKNKNDQNEKEEQDPLNGLFQLLHWMVLFYIKQLWASWMVEKRGEEMHKANWFKFYNSLIKVSLSVWAQSFPSPGKLLTPGENLFLSLLHWQEGSLPLAPPKVLFIAP